MSPLTSLHWSSVVLITCSHLLLCWSHICHRRRSGCWSHEASDQGSACVWPETRNKIISVFGTMSLLGPLTADGGWEGKLTNFSVQGKSKSLTNPRSSPVATFRPAWDTQAQITSALSAFLGQIPKTSSPRMLQRQKKSSFRTGMSLLYQQVLKFKILSYIEEKSVPLYL